MRNVAQSSSLLLEDRDGGPEIHRGEGNDDGVFKFPNSYPTTFKEGSGINITWSTNYQASNLYYYQSGKVATSIQITTNLAQQWYQWQVYAEESDLTLPYVFRVVNTFGTTEDQTQGGFWSASFYISRTGPSASASSSKTSSSSTSTTSSTQSTSSSSTTTSSFSSSTSSIIQVPTPVTSTPPPSSSNNNASLGAGAIAGIAIGAAIGVIALVVAGFCLGKRKRMNGSQRDSQATSFNVLGHRKPRGSAGVPMSGSSVQGSSVQGTIYSAPEMRTPTTYYEMSHS
ncbi:hypothetical protein F4777DRAFT_592105 [Nemania sp. FL0916]|nr:hypothetical protein F4777DRAFT_592105 [Nemania sp. FL0916]